MKDGTVVTIKTENGSLTATTGTNTFKLLAASETDFYITSSFLKIHFMNDDKGNVSGFQFQRYGGSEFVDKIK